MPYAFEQAADPVLPPLFAPLPATIHDASGLSRREVDAALLFGFSDTEIICLELMGNEPFTFE
jgi:hypothetical protein